MTEQEVHHADVNYFDSGRTLLGSADSAEVHESGGLLIANSGLPVVTFNVAFVTRPLADPAAAISRVLNYFRARELPFQLQIRANLDPSSEEAALAGGFKLVRPRPTMVLRPVPDIPPPPTDREIREVREEQAFDDFTATCAVGFGRPEISELFSARLLEHPSARWFVGYVEGQLGTTSLLLQTGSVAGVYYVATLDELRRRGFGEAMTWAAVRAGLETGCDMASLQSSEMGQPIYERMGFRHVARYNCYLPPDQAEA